MLSGGSRGGIRFMKFLVKCLVHPSHALKSIGHYNHFSTLQIENGLHHLCFYCCGVNKPEPASHFSFYLLTHFGGFLPVLFLHPSSLRVNSLSEQEIQIRKQLTASCAARPRERQALEPLGPLLWWCKPCQTDPETASSLHNSHKANNSFRALTAFTLWLKTSQEFIRSYKKLL